jgi:hypothetical protein
MFNMDHINPGSKVVIRSFGHWALWELPPITVPGFVSAHGELLGALQPSECVLVLAKLNRCALVMSRATALVGWVNDNAFAFY